MGFKIKENQTEALKLMGRVERAEETQRRLKRLVAYEEYMQSPVWLEKRWRVMERCKWICEGCGSRKATQVHHVRYPRTEVPGSAGWCSQEKLYDLVGICERCHREVHRGWEKR
jgi:hypothetical protein